MPRTLLCAVCLENVVKHPKHYACPKCWHEHDLKTNPEWFQGLIDEELARRRQEYNDNQLRNIDTTILDEEDTLFGGVSEYIERPENELIAPMTQEEAEAEVARAQSIKEYREKYRNCDPLQREYWNIGGLSSGERRALCVEREIQAHKHYYGHKLTSEDGAIWLAIFERKLALEDFALEQLKRKADAYRRRISTARKKIDNALADSRTEADYSIWGKPPILELLDRSHDPLFGTPILKEDTVDEEGIYPFFFERIEALPEDEKEVINWLRAIRLLREDPISAGKYFNMSSRDYCKWVASILRKLENSQK